MKLLKLTTLASLASAEYVNFTQNGADWAEKYPNCGKAYQSPIDLKT